jgi:hypothetical protein
MRYLSFFFRSLLCIFQTYLHMSNRNDSSSLSSSNSSSRSRRLRQVLRSPIRYPQDDLANYRPTGPNNREGTAQAALMVKTCILNKIY